MGIDTFEEQVVSMKRLFQKGREHGVQWRLTKCSFCYPSVVLIGFKVSAHGRQPNPSKVKAPKEWPEEQSIEDLVSMFHFANYLREFIPDLHRITAPLKPYRAKGANWETYLQDKVAQKATQELRMSVANETPLVNPDFKAASNYIALGKPFLLFVDASDFGYSGVLAQAQVIHGTPGPIAVLSKSLDETQQRWTPMECEARALYEAAIWSQKYAKSFRIFLLTDHRNNTFRTMIQPTRRIAHRNRARAPLGREIVHRRITEHPGRCAKSRTSRSQGGPQLAHPSGTDP